MIERSARCVRWAVGAVTLSVFALAHQAGAQGSTSFMDAWLLAKASLPLSARIHEVDGRSASDFPRTWMSDYAPILAKAAPRRTPARLVGANVRVAISIGERTLSAIVGRDTVFTAPVSVARGLTLSYGRRSWTFRTPRGGRRVLRKLVDPVWTPPDWHYAEAALDNGLRLVRMPRGGVTLDTRSRLVVRHGVVGVLFRNAHFAELPIDEHLVFGDALFIPPLGTRNRRVAGELGKYALDLGDGYLIHGTTNAATIGQASTHGCIRMRDDDLAWLFANVPRGARISIE
ncbi:MAG: L,D-transpeptidase [Gemmatimonadaceae bacterium]|nr:L,D-transpeptidase [Gemmatimonadaceae bacterium]